MSLKSGQHRVLTKYLAAFLVCVSIPVMVLGLVFYNNASFILLKELEGHIVGEMGRLSDAFDDAMSELYETAFRASYDPSLSWYNVERNDYTRVNVVRKLSDYKRDYVDYLLLSYSSDAPVFTNVGSMSWTTVERSVFSSRQSAVEGSYSEYVELLRHAQSPEMVPTGASLSGSDEPRAYLTYTYPLLNRDPVGVLSFVMSEASLTRLVGGILGNLNGAVVVLDRDGAPLLALEKRMKLSGLPPEAAVGRQGEPKVTSVTVGGERVTYVGLTSRTSGLRYVAVLSLTDYMQSVMQTKRYVLLSILCVLLLSAFAAVGTALLIYRPIEKLTNYVATSSGGSRSSRNEDELTYISSVLSETLNANERLSQRLVTQLTFVQELALLKIVRGQVTRRADVDAMLSANDIRFADRYFGVAVISIEGGLDEGRDMDSLLPVLRSALDAVPEPCGHYCIGIDRRQAVLVINAAHDDSEHLLMDAIVRTCTSALRASIDAEADVGVGRLYGDCLLLNKSFLEALAASEYRLLKGHQHKVYYADIDFEHGAAHWYPTEQQGMLRQCLKQGNLPAFVEVVDDIIRRADEKELSLDALRCVCFDVINSTIKLLDEYGIAPGGDYVRELSRFESLEDLRHRLIEIARRVCDHVSEANKTESNRMSYLRAAIIEYLYKNYNNSQLNLEMVADEFGISAKHLSAIFRQLTESRFVDYLRKLRVSHAKGLLASGGRTVSGISRDVGFANPARFIRSFKSVEGMTPGRFREIARSPLAVTAYSADGEKQTPDRDY